MRISMNRVAVVVLAVALALSGLVASIPARAAVPAGGGISVPSTNVRVGKPVTVTFSAPADKVSATNWVGWYHQGETPGNTASTYWYYTQTNTQTAPSSGVSDGTITFTGMAVGTYTVYFFYNDGYTTIGSPITMRVLPDDPLDIVTSGSGTASASPASPAAGDTVTLTQQAATGYRFGGWQVVDPNDGSLTIRPDGTFTMPQTPVTLQATFVPASYTVHFDANTGGTGTMGDVALTYDQAANLPANAFTRSGYTFAGWATRADGKAVYADGASVVNLAGTDQARVVLYAVWHATVTASTVPSADVLNVDFASGAPVDHAQALAATTVGAPSVATDSTLGTKVATFNGTADAYQYDFSSQFSKLTAAFSIECRFRWNGAALSTLSASAFPSICSGEQSGGMNIEVYQNKLNASAYVGGYKYAYAGANAVTPGTWYDATATFDGSNLRFYLDGTLVATTAAAGSMTQPPTAARKWVLGADVSSSGGTEAYAPVSLANARVWAKALTAAQVSALASSTARRAVSVTKSGQGTATADVATAVQGDTVSLTEQPADGYHFGGWQVTSPSDGSVRIGTDATFTMPAAPVTVVATFVPNTYAVHYDANGAQGAAMADSQLTYDTPAALRTDTYTLAGQHFVGWATTPTGRPAYADGATVSNLATADGAVVTLFAVFVPDGQYLVQVDHDAHGTAAADVTAASAGATVTLQATPDTGYHFTGWRVTDPSDGSVVVAGDGTFTMPSRAVTVRATFAANTYRVHFDGTDADTGTMADQSLTYGTATALTPNAFSRDGFTFAGWSTSPRGQVAYADKAPVSTLTPVDGATVTLYAVWQRAVVVPGSWTSLPAGFVTDTFKVPAVRVGGAVSQPVQGLWNGTAPTTYTKTAGSSWLGVDGQGVVSGTAPSGATTGSITVTATQGATTSSILVEVPVLALASPRPLHAVTWDTWGDGANVTDAVGKDLAVIAAQGLDVIGFQDGATVPVKVATSLGWHVYVSGNLGLVSPYPIAIAGRVAATSSAPGEAATLTVDGTAVRVWDTQLDEGAYGPTAACAGATTPLVLQTNERNSTRYAQAKAVSDQVKADVTAANGAPVLLLGDLASPSGADWTQATSAQHCNAGAVDWPVPDLFTAAGLSDTYRQLQPDPAAKPGNTLLFASQKDRVDYVLSSGALHPQESHPFSLGFPSSASPAANSWTSDHTAVVTTFALGDGTTPVPAPAPGLAVTTTTLAYQVGHGPADAATLLADAGASTDPGATLAVDTSSVNAAVPGWYTALVTASANGTTSDPVAVTVRIAPVPVLSLGATSLSVESGTVLAESGVLARILPALDVPGAVRVDLSTVDANHPGNYRAIVTATDEWGFALTREITVTVTAVVLHNTASPTMGGTVAVGSTITADPGTWDRSDLTYAYQWLASGSPIDGATARQFTPSNDQNGKLLSVRVTASRPGSDAVAATSATTRVDTSPIRNTATPVVSVASGGTTAGSTLQVTTGTWNADGLTFTYAWYCDGATLRGASKPTVVVPAGCAGKSASARVTASRAGSDPVAAYSNSLPIDR